MAFIIAFTAVSGYFILDGMYGDKIQSPWPQVILYVAMGWMVAKLFMNVFALAVDATLQCFVADEELNSSGGGGGAQYTPEELKVFLKDPNKKGKRCGCC